MQLFQNGRPTQAYWDRYSAIVNGIKAAGLAHPHTADTHAMVRRVGMSVEATVREWGSDRLNCPSK